MFGRRRAPKAWTEAASWHARMIDELAMQRRDILALHVARDPELAFDLAVFLMVKEEGGYCYDSAGSSLSARPPSDPVLRSQMPDAPVQALLAQADDALDRSWIGHETLPAKFDAFRALPRAAREAWLGAAVARTLEASAAAGGRLCAFHDHLGTLLGIDVAQHWRPTALNWFDRVPKALCLAALTEVGGPGLAARHAKAKKAEIAEACGRLFAGEGIVEAEVKAAALAWAPVPMRFAAPEVVEESPPWAEDEAQGAELGESVVIASGDDEHDADCEASAEGGPGIEDESSNQSATGAAQDPEGQAGAEPEPGGGGETDNGAEPGAGVQPDPEHEPSAEDEPVPADARQSAAKLDRAA